MGSERVWREECLIRSSGEIPEVDREALEYGPPEVWIGVSFFLVYLLSCYGIVDVT